MSLKGAVRPARILVAFSEMDPRGANTTNLVVVSLGAALVVFFAGVTAAVAAGATPPTAMWAAGGAVSGALVGLLVPSPGEQAGHEAAAKALEKVAAAATTEATEASDPQAAESARAAASDAHEKAAAHTVAAASGASKDTAWLLFVAFLGLLILSVALAGGLITPPQEFVGSLTNLTKVVISLTSAAGTALVGILAPQGG